MGQKDKDKEPWSCPKVAWGLGLVPTSRASVSPSVFNRLGPSGSDNLVMPGQTVVAEGETSPSQMPTMPWVPLRPCRPGPVPAPSPAPRKLMAAPAPVPRRSLKLSWA